MVKPVSYLQTDARWKNHNYSAKGESKTIGSSGCGITAAAMVIATLKDKNEVYAFLNPIKKAYKSKKLALKIIRENDYIKEPKQDGYRSYHLVFEYQGAKEDIKGYKIELQLRNLFTALLGYGSRNYGSY